MHPESPRTVSNPWTSKYPYRKHFKTKVSHIEVHGPSGSGLKVYVRRPVGPIQMQRCLQSDPTSSPSQASEGSSAAPGSRP